MTNTSRPVPRPPAAYVHGDGSVVVVPARVAAWLQRHAGLRSLRTECRGVDREVDAVLVALAVAAAAWSGQFNGSGSGTVHAGQPEPAPVSTLTTAQAATLLGCTDRAVRKAIAAGRLHAVDDGGRWRIAREDLEHYRAGRAA